MDTIDNVETLLHTSNIDLRFKWAFHTSYQIVWPQPENFVEFVRNLKAECLVDDLASQRRLLEVAQDTYYIELIFKLMPPKFIEWLLVALDERPQYREWLCEEFAKRDVERAAKFFGEDVETVKGWLSGETKHTSK